jgi:threonine/homoserine/homoserine lactone efflux protein
MSLLFLLKGISVGFLASVPLGPIGVLCIQRTLSRGKMVGFVSGLGAAFSDTIYAIIAGFSLSFVLNIIESQMLWFQLAGAVILLFMGIRIFLSNPASQLRRQKSKNTALLQDFASTFLITITNPLAIFLFIAAFSFVGSEKQLSSQLLLVGGVFIGASAWWLTLTMLVGLFRHKINLRRLYWINKIAGSSIVVLVIIALVTLLVKTLFLK